MSKDFESSMAKELEFHIEQATADYIAQGMSPIEARRRARKDFGAMDLAKEELRDTRSNRVQRAGESLLQDLRYSLRNLRSHPGLTALAVGMLALGLGVNASVFTVIDAALFRGYSHVAASDRLVQITTTITQTLYYPDFQFWQAQSKEFQGIALVRGVFHSLNDDTNTPETLFTTEVTSGTFRMLGVRPLLGRDFRPADEQPGADPVVILRHDVWRRRFAANPAIIGQRVMLSGRPATVIGVMPQGFSFPWGQSLWTPLVPSRAALSRQSGYARYAIGRLAPGASLASARSELEGIATQLSAAYPRTNADIRPILTRFEDWYIGQRNRDLYRLTWAAVVFLLIIICANVANLLVGYAIQRTREISIRLALGAGRWRIIRGFLLESFILSGLGGFLGWALAWTFLHFYPTVEVSEVLLDLNLNPRVAIYLTAVAIAAALASSVAAAAYLTRVHAQGASQTASRSATAGMRGRRLSDILVALETVVAVVLLCGAAVLGRSFLHVQQASLGANTHNVLRVDLYTDRPFADRTARRQFYSSLLTRLAGIPGVEEAAYGDVPSYDAVPHHYHFTGQSPRPASALPNVPLLHTSPGYFRTLGAQIVAGRDFTSPDIESSAPVAIVNQRFAEHHWPGESALGKTFRVLPAFPGEPILPWLTVVGVSSNIIQNDRTRQTFVPLVYVPSAGGDALLRTRIAPAKLALAVKRELYAAAPEIPAPVWPLDELLAENYAFERDITTLFLVFAGASLIVAAIGLFAALSRAVVQRSREIGIRLAVGANPRDILRLSLHQGLTPVALGLVLGLALSASINHLLRSQLVAVSPADPLSFTAATLLLLSSAALGCFVPALRATRIDPSITLRQD